MQGYLKPSTLRAGIVGGIVGIIVLLLSLVPILVLCLGLSGSPYICQVEGLPLIPILGLCFLLFEWVVYIGTGVFAVRWGKGQGAAQPLLQSLIQGAIGGGIAGGIAQVVKFVANVCLGIILRAAFETSVFDRTPIFVGNLVGYCFSLVLGIVAAIVLGLVGGLVYSLLLQQRKPKTSS